MIDWKQRSWFQKKYKRKIAEEENKEDEKEKQTYNILKKWLDPWIRKYFSVLLYLSN